jgi:hypothetical protein
MTAHINSIATEVNARLEIINVTGLTSGTSTANRTANTARVTAALAAAGTADPTLTGRVIRFPRGWYTLSPFTLTNSDSGKLTSLTIEGEGQHNTVLDFTGTTGDGITIPGSAGVRIRDLHVRSAAAHNIAVYGVSSHTGAGALTTNSYWLSIDRVRTQAAGGSGLYLSGSYLTSLSDVLALSNGAHGFQVGGYTTSTSFRNCQGRSNTLSGYSLNDLTYSSLTGCAADNNSQYGYFMSNVRGVVFTACGAESQQFDGFRAEASTALATGAIAPDVTGVVLNGCFGYNNGLTSTSYANLLHTVSANSKVIDITLVGCADQSPPAGRPSIIGSGVSTLPRLGGTYAAAVTLDATSFSPTFGPTTTLSTMVLSDDAPTLAIRETDATTDEKNWDFVLSGGQLLVRGRNDALSSSENVWAVDRTGVNATTQQWFTSGTERMRMTSASVKASVPFEAPSYTVAGLPVATTAGRVAYASNGRKNGEGAAAGTGVLVFSDGTAWRACDTGATVAA